MQGTSLHAVTIAWKAQVHDDLQQLESLALPQSEDAATVSEALGGSLTEEAYLWALGTVRGLLGQCQLGWRVQQCLLWDYCR